MNSTKKCVLVPYEKYQRLMKTPKALELTSVDRIQEEEEEEEAGPVEPARLEEEQILEHFPKNLKGKAKILLNTIKQNNSLDWNLKGELVVNDEAVQHSHIADLVKDALVTYKHFEPVGLQVFYSHLNNIPLSLIRNPQRRLLLQKGTGTPPPQPPPPPPPGLPNKRKAINILEKPKKRSKADTWKQLWTTLT